MLELQMGINFVLPVNVFCTLKVMLAIILYKPPTVLIQLKIYFNAILKKKANNILDA